MKKKLVSTLLALAMCLALAAPAFAAGGDVETDKSYSTTSRAISNRVYEMALYDGVYSMTVPQLNSYIDTCKKNAESLSRTTGEREPEAWIALAWVAAAMIAKKVGFPCAAALVENSVRGIDYSEFNGIFAEKIKASDVYKNRQISLTPVSIKWEKSDDQDLFYALHEATISYSSVSSQGGIATVTDIFDFAYVDDWSGFTNKINNWGWLCQETGVLNPINVSIRFNL